MLHSYLWQLTDPSKHDEAFNGAQGGEYDYNARALVLQALRRALLRESVLLRLLPQRSELDETGWGELLAKSFLADLYDDRMYEELRLRAQTFEVRTGGDFAAGHADGQDASGAEGKELGLSVVPLPPQMINDLRVKLHVWTPPQSKNLGISQPKSTTDSIHRPP
jgi:hypothetical protein